MWVRTGNWDEEKSAAKSLFVRMMCCDSGRAAGHSLEERTLVCGMTYYGINLLDSGSR